jgi:type IV pilus assembly protein PilB
VECGGTGYKGRMAVAEILKNNDILEEMIHKNVKASDIRQMMRDAGFKPLAFDALQKASMGFTSLSEVEREVGAL